jgi:hypothetical protein
MSYTDRIKSTKNPQEAMLVLAQGIDEILAHLAVAPEVQDDGWGNWSDVAPADGVPAGPPPGGYFEPVVIPVDHEEVARIREQLAEAETKLEAAHHTGDKTLLVQLTQRVDGLRGRLDLAENPGSILMNSGDMVGDPDGVFEVTVTPTDVIINLPPASEDQKESRRQMAEAVDLPGFFPVVMRQSDEAIQAIIDNYVKGGPMWLYADNRDLVMQMPLWARQVMVADVNAYGNVRVAHEFARDVMKEESGEGTDIDITAGNLVGMIEHGGTPYTGRGEG